jgi:biopolymer transport protein ExbB
MQALHEGGIISWSVFIVLVVMSVGTFYILFTKLMQQQKIISQGRKVRASFWNSPNLRDASGKLDSKSAYRAIVDDALNAQEQHDKLDDPVDRHDWIANTLARSQGSIGARLGEGLAFLATVGSTAPFIGLFGTVIGIYRALIKLGSSGGTPGIDKVAGPVGEALIMTAIGLIVAVPAVLAFNWLQSRNKSIARRLSTFSNDVLGSIMSGGQVKPASLTPAKAAAPAAAPKKA